MHKETFPEIPKEKFVFVQREENIHDTRSETGAVGCFGNVWSRFKRKKSSVAAAGILILLILFAIFAPVFAAYDMSFTESYYTCALPKSRFLSRFGIWNGCTDKTLNQQTYDYYEAIGAIVEVKDSYERTANGRSNTCYDVVVDTYRAQGYVYLYLSAGEYEKALEYQEETGVRLFYPMIDVGEIPQESNREDANYWYAHNAKGVAERDAEGNFIPIYRTDGNSGDGYVYHLQKMNGNQYQVRVCYYDWFTYKNGQEPAFLFGTDSMGHDILVRLGAGARFSLLLTMIVSVINFCIGTVYGAIEGYYGGKPDLIMERFVDILSSIPYLVLFSLLQLRWGEKIGVAGALLLTFVLTGWIQVSGTVRTQFYRYKGQEYVLAARTLGAKDRRLMVRHILPNALGTIVTACILTVPGVIFTETSLSYLGVLNLDSATLTSVGTMLSNAQTSLSTYPHVIFFPALFLSLMMISFHLLGNGLRDAWNPILRGAEE